MIRKVLVANRGEIAVRIMRTLREMCIATVAVYAAPDATAPHVRMADEAAPLQGDSAAAYLDAARLVDVACQSGADAVHPGYGFLSENADFARRCGAAGLCFIGPPPDVIAAMGDKIVARDTMARAGVPVLQGAAWDRAPESSELHAEAAKIGFPLLVKAAAGGGGKGMRIVRSDGDLESAVASAGREAGAAFGDARVFLEKYIERPRHVEVQILGDHHGHIVHLFERECSLQRRHQKIVEEAPSPALDPAQRDALTASAVRAAQAIGYRNAGTVEFILDPSGQHYFLEVNTRLQVEHGVTEWITGLDLVRLQVDVAGGAHLPFGQDDIVWRGHAIECRICAEDAYGGFLPAVGDIACYRAPEGPGIRVDSGVATGSVIGVRFDPLLAKIMAWAPDRPQALARMRAALAETVILGITTNIDFLQDLLSHPAVHSAAVHTQFLEEAAITPPATPGLAAFAVAAMHGRSGTRDLQGREAAADPWVDAGPWRGGMA